MAHVILGLLMLWPQTLYELTKNFQAGVSLFYSASTGSIKRALDKLLANGEITVDSKTGPRGKRPYRITAAGRAQFRSWMLDDLDTGGMETEMLARVYFLGLLEPAERSQVAEQIRRRIGEDLDRLERLEVQVRAASVADGFEDVATYQRATLKYGLAAHRVALAWADDELPQSSPADESAR
ncbi:PadR family transcriptional regulator [Propionimicrobium sp. PCR01-08-3]|uniref:PadR family transcriptional regulator n=1 Tax=Propionimicrobium sp. PCR01-08-3 TaxID=3052086 RepID=UPI00255C2CE6|nr:PadR family transcriptional regulator [Propionimicrobium sp. PCR01-08-3]WIY82688.1 PadR family transcriptional regulator [Propionimicrobium sp. PCR01-08-3]